MRPGCAARCLRAVKGYGELAGNRRIAQATGEDVTTGAAMLLSLFIRDPQFQGQTKERLASAEATRLVESAVKDHFDHWLSADPATARALLDRIAERAEERQRRRQQTRAGAQDRDPQAAAARQARRLHAATAPPGPRSSSSRATAPAARPSRRVTARPRQSCRCAARSSTWRAPRPTRCAPIRNSRDIILALGCGSGSHYREEGLRYERVIIMTDADVDGAHIASLLMTFFFREMPKLVENGHLFLALPPLYRLTQGDVTHYARDDAHREELLRSAFNGRGKVEVSRFKGLGEMPARYLKATTMDPGPAHLAARDLAAKAGSRGSRDRRRRIRTDRKPWSRP